MRDLTSSRWAVLKKLQCQLSSDSRVWAPATAVAKRTSSWQGRLQLCQSQARRAVASKKPTSVAHTECSGEVVGSSWCCCLVARVCCSGCVCHIAWRCGVRPVDHRANVCVCGESVCVCVFSRELGCCAFDHVWTCSVQTQGTQWKTVAYLPWRSEIIEGHCSSSRQSLAASCAVETRRKLRNSRPLT